MKKLLTLFFILMITSAILAQVSVNTDNSSADPSAILDVKSTSLGFLPPRMNTIQRDAISSPAAGLLIFNSDCNDFQLFNGTAWIPITNSGAVALGTISGDETPCVSSTGQVYAVSAFPGVTGYSWSVPTGAEVTAGQGTNSVTVNFGDNNGDITVFAYGECWKSQSSILSLSLLPLPDAPTAGTHVPAQTQITWNWNAVSGATGYKINDENDYSSATDLSNVTSFVETGLTCETSYTRYVWAYDECPGSAPLVMNASTTTCPFICGTSTITVNHVAGAVAPVNKTVTYGTVTNVPGATSKCWITSNLGSSHQATAVNDTTEASAGWYWQFNRAQGYKHTGLSRTPNTPWITSINESGDWQSSNNPCTIELGTGWRMPTWTEWDNVRISGGWTNWNGPWNSILKMHAAGSLYAGHGGLSARGGQGIYWSITQGSYPNAGINLLFSTTSLGVSYGDKAYGETLRCIKD